MGSDYNHTDRDELHRNSFHLRKKPRAMLELSNANAQRPTLNAQLSTFNPEGLGPVPAAIGLKA